MFGYIHAKSELYKKFECKNKFILESEATILCTKEPKYTFIHELVDRKKRHLNLTYLKIIGGHCPIGGILVHRSNYYMFKKFYDSHTSFKCRESTDAFKGMEICRFSFISCWIPLSIYLETGIFFRYFCTAFSVSSSVNSITPTLLIEGPARCPI
jgi:hypothetical protein